VVIGLSPPLTYCAIFSVMSSYVIDLNMCICMRVYSYRSLIVPVCCAAAAEARSPPPPLPTAEPTQFSGLADSPVLFTGR